MPQPDLEISLYRRDAESYGVERRFNEHEIELRQRELDPAAYGEYLAAQLLAEPEVRSFFDQALAVTQAGDEALRLRLNIAPGAAELHDLRWNGKTADLLRELPHDRGIKDVRFTHDGKAIVIVDNNRVLRRWPIDPESPGDVNPLIKVACAKLSRSAFTPGEWRKYVGETEPRPTCPEAESVPPAQR